MFSYQGKLTDTLEQPVADTLYAIRFMLYAQPTGGSPFWQENQQVRTQKGLFSVLLGSATHIDSVPDAGALYLGMAVGGGAELVPRLRIASAAYACLTARAADADRLQGKDTTAFDSRYVNEGQANSVTSAMITDATIAAADLGQMGASSGQVMKWTGSAWAPGNDSIGSGGGGDNAWVRSGSDSVLYTIHNLGIARGGAGSMLHGSLRFSDVNLGIACTTGTSGLNYGYATVGGGQYNTASGVRSTVTGGYYGAVSGNYSAVIGGANDTCAANYSLVVGSSVRARSGAQYTFAFGEGCTTSTARAVVFYRSGAPTKLGVGVQNPENYIDVTGGSYCDATGWHNPSSRELKRDIVRLTPAEYQAILQQLLATDVARYKYKLDEHGREHIGLIAEEAPDVLTDREHKSIGTGDAIGFLMAAVKAEQAEIEALKDELKRR